MTDPSDAALRLTVGGRTRAELIGALAEAGVGLNVYASTLLEHGVFDDTAVEAITVVGRTVGELGLEGGGTLPQILAAARERGLLPCPPVTGPYLRLAVLDQTTASEPVMSNGRAPTGSVTVASERLRDDDEYPRGFYLRVLDGRPWLRGYRCDDEHAWSLDDRFAFRLPAVCGLAGGWPRLAWR